MKALPCLFGAAALLSALGCERKTVVVELPPATPVEAPVAQTKTLETSRLGSAIDDFERRPTAENQADVKKAMAKLDGEIAELEEYIAKHTGSERSEAAAKLENMQAYRKAEMVRFGVAQVKGAVSPSAPADARTGSEKIGDSARKAGESVEDAAKKVGDSIKDAVK